MEIEYDPAKCERNIRERGLDFRLAGELDWSTAVMTQDTRRAYPEPRWQVLGTIGERLHMLVFTPLPHGRGIRVISLRKANASEVKRYEHETQSRND